MTTITRAKFSEQIVSGVWQHGRRQFLLGSGGYLLGLPLLASILPRTGRAQDRHRGPKRLVLLRTEHGAVLNRNMFPALSELTHTEDFVPGHVIRMGGLRRTVNGDRASLSPVMTAPASLLTDRLVGKMNVLRGFDIPFYTSHQHGIDFGNMAGRFGGADRVPGLPDHGSPTIDQFLAWSPGFYRDLTGVRARVITAGNGGSVSWNYTNPATRTGNVVEVALEGNPTILFARLFSTPVAGGGPRRPPVVDRVIESYRALRHGNQRLSAEDRLRLDAHMQRLAELQRQVAAAVPPACEAVREPGPVGSTATNPTEAARKWGLMNDVISAALICGLSRLAAVRVQETFTNYSGNWHQDIAHNAGAPASQELLRLGLERFFSAVFLDLARKLDVDEGEGRTFLDNSLIVWSQESGQRTHLNYCTPVVTAGSAGGFFRTGIYANYENRVTSSMDTGGADPLYHGILHHQFLGTVAQAMGALPSEYEPLNRAGNAGYGSLFVDSTLRRKYAAGVFDRVGTLLPFITNG